MSNNKNKNSSGESRLKKLKKEVKNLLQTQTDYNKEREKISEAARKLNKEELEELKKNNPYMYEIFQMQKAKEEMSAYIGNYKDAKEKVLAIEKRYAEEYEKIKANKQNLSADEQAKAFSSLELLKNSQLQAAQSEVWESRGEKIADIFGDELVNMLQDYENFEFDMKKVTKRLYDYIIDEAVHAVLQQVMGIQVMQSMMNALSVGSSKGGFIGASSSILKGVFGAIGKHHSGGIIPAGANAELPGTEEQLALLKGGERILSPSENVDYNSNSQNSSSPVVFNNFNIKAWDSKDVQKYLLENKQLLNSITYDGIKNNNSQLRQIVRNA